MSDFCERFDRCVGLFQGAIDKTGGRLAMISFAADAGSERAQHDFASEDYAADLRSVSKVIVGLVAGALIEGGTTVGQGTLSLETRVEPLLRRHMSDRARVAWEGVRVLDLLNNTIGHDEGFLFRKDLGDRSEKDYLPYIFEKPVPHGPGVHFSYSNVGPYLFSVLLQDWLGNSLHDLAEALVLGPLGIRSTWRKFGGYSAGCTGLRMSNGDLIKVASLLRNGGMEQGCSVVSREWVERMASPISETPSMYDPARVFPKFAYGLGLWICKNGTFYCDGTDGQYMIVVPGRSLAISTTGNQPDMKPITKCMVPFLD